MFQPELHIDLAELERVNDDLRRMPVEVRRAAIHAGNKFIIEWEQDHQAPYSKVTYKQAYGGFLSDAQRAYVMAGIRRGSIKVPYKRTGKLRKGWQLLGKGTDNETVVNDDVAAPYVKTQESQSYMMYLRAWTTVVNDLADMLPGLLKYAELAAQIAVKKLGID